MCQRSECTQLISRYLLTSRELIMAVLYSTVRCLLPKRKQVRVAFVSCQPEAEQTSRGIRGCKRTSKMLKIILQVTNEPQYFVSFMVVITDVISMSSYVRFDRPQKKKENVRTGCCNVKQIQRTKQLRGSFDLLVVQ